MRWTALFLVMLVGATAPASELTPATGAPAQGVERLSRDEVFLVSLTPPTYPAAKKSFVREGMSMLQLVQAVGPGWCRPDEGIGILTWAFSDNTALQAYAYGPAVILSFKKGSDTGYMWWWPEAKP